VLPGMPTIPDATVNTNCDAAYLSYNCGLRKNYLNGSRFKDQDRYDDLRIKAETDKFFVEVDQKDDFKGMTLEIYPVHESYENTPPKIVQVDRSEFTISDDGMLVFDFTALVEKFNSEVIAKYTNVRILKVRY
jgi:hypothetical protein